MSPTSRWSLCVPARTGECQTGQKPSAHQNKIGPTLGGWLITNYDWPYVFYINFLPSAVLVYTIFKGLDPEPKQLGLLKAADWPGIALLRNLGGTIGIGLLQTALSLRYSFHFGRLSELASAVDPSTQFRLASLTHVMTEKGMDPTLAKAKAIHVFGMIMNGEAYIWPWGINLTHLRRRLVTQYKTAISV